MMSFENKLISMNHLFTLIFLVFFSFAGQHQAFAQSQAQTLNKNIEKAQYKSVYTSLDVKDCKKISAQEESSVHSCKGYGGYKVIIYDTDLRQHIVIIAPGEKFKISEDDDNKVIDLDTGAFHYVGSKMEWRLRKEGKKLEPIAIIVRFKVQENPDDYKSVTDYLIVSKLYDKNKVCVVGKLKNYPGFNEEARKIADNPPSDCAVVPLKSR